MEHLKTHIISFVLAITMFSMAHAAIQLPDLPDKEGMAVKGYVHDSEKPLSGVLVTNGYSFATTDENGAYYLPSDADAEFVYLVTPAGYNADCRDGLTRFYQTIDKNGGIYRADFQLTSTGDDTYHKFLVLGDPQMRDDHDYGLFEEQALPDIKETIAKLQKEGDNPHLLVLGDVCFNTWGTYPRYEKFWKDINTPLFHCPGNHDKQIVPDKKQSTKDYQAIFGPLYYAFNKGKIHYLMLDNIMIAGRDEITNGIYEEALEWVKKDLEYVSHGTTVVVGLHQPVTWTVGSRAAYKPLLDLLSNYKTLILSAHKHYGKNLGNYNSHIEERIQTALCGAYWYGDVAKDGIPLGYYIYEDVGDSLCWQYKPLGETTDKAFKIHPPVVEGNNLRFDINVFDYDNHWNVTWKLDGVDQGKLPNIEDYDPHAYKLYINHTKTWCRPVKSTHIFRCTVPKTALYIECNATDRFGHTYSQIYRLRLADLPDKEGMGIKGYVLNGEEAVPGVLVTNGYSFATTDENGVYYLPSNPDAEFVYLVTPAGYNAGCKDGITKFYQRIDKNTDVFQANFELTATGDDTHHKFLVLGDPQMRDNHDYGLFERKALPDIKDMVGSIKEEGLNNHIIVLGDICFNTWNSYPRYSKYWKDINTPLYHCPGNHDKHIVTDKTASTLEYCTAFGPLYYSFNKGRIHYLMLDNIKITATDKYTTALYPEALEWVKKDLSHVPHGTTVVVATHQPLTWTSESRTANKTLLDLLSNYKTLILSAHKHYGRNLGKYNENIEERIQTALCGAYWYGNVAKDGIPLGYYVYEAVGDSLCWQFKALGQSTDYQFKVYDPVPFGNNLKFDINIFDYDSNWNVTWKLDGVDKGKMFSYEAYDPYAYELYNNHEKTWCRPVKTTHMFYCTVPVTTRSMECNITDRFGRTFSKTYIMTPSGIKDMHKDNVNVYPNPVSDYVIIEANTDIKRIDLFNINGKLVSQIENTGFVNMSSLPSGHYIALISLDDNRLVYKRIIKR